MNGVILENINSPEELKKLPISDLPELASEIRHYIVDTLATHPGHLASSLGTVELTLALHYVFNTPDDKLIWDVGHQAYTHKIITGRRDAFPTIRTYGGLSGFPKMDESPYDAFGTGHSSTSISAALGMATASKLQGNTSRQHIAIIGDGSMTGGEAFEALNNAGVSKANILVILNDNGISIDKSVGGLSRYLIKITASRKYNELKERMWKHVGGDTRNTKSKNFFQKTLFSIKTAMLRSSNFFESLGFRYFGPIDGHDVETLVEVLQQLKNIKGPKLLHIITRKGKGLRRAERNPVIYHAPGKFDAETGKQVISMAVDQPLKYQDVFGQTIIELAERNSKIVGITPAMPSGCSLNLMMERMPNRVFDVGIAEQHAVTFAAGLAAQGMTPFCNIYSSFLQRAYDQVIHDVALQKLPVILCLDRAGLVGDDGPTHHGAFDLAYLRPIPNLTIAAPMDEHELRNLMYTAQQEGGGAFVIRYPRGASVHTDWQCAFEDLPIGKGRMMREGKAIQDALAEVQLEDGTTKKLVSTAILSIGHIGNSALKAADILEQKYGIGIGVFDMRFLKPLDTTMLDEIAQCYRHVVTIEDGVKLGGLGSAVLEYYNACANNAGSQNICNTNGSSIQEFNVPQVTILGLPDEFVPHGSILQLQKDCHIDVDSIVKTILEWN